MTNEVVVTIIVVAGSIITTLITTFGLIIISRITTLKREVNGKMQQLLSSNKSESRAIGNLEGRAEQTQERNDERDMK